MHIQQCYAPARALQRYRWIDYQYVSEDAEREHIRKTIAIHQKVLGERPLGIYQGKPNVNTRKLIVEEGASVQHASVQHAACRALARCSAALEGARELVVEDLQRAELHCNAASILQ